MPFLYRCLLIKTIVLFPFRYSMSTILGGVSTNVTLEHLAIEISDLELSQTTKLNVFREQMRYFEVCVKSFVMGFDLIQFQR